jgi:hypothetical protein
MTTQQIINYYSNLLILQYQNQPNAVATIHWHRPYKALTLLVRP